MSKEHDLNCFVFVCFRSYILVPPLDERQAQAVTEEPGVESEETNAINPDEALIKEVNNSDDKENGNDKADLELNEVNPELIELVKTTEHKNRQ